MCISVLTNETAALSSIPKPQTRETLILKTSTDKHKPRQPQNAEAEARLKDSHHRFCQVLNLGEEALLDGNLTAAAGLSQIAARQAFPGNVGLFTSPRLERLLLEIGKQLPTLPTGHEHYRGDSLAILHVLSHARPIGGDTRFVWRWIQEDFNNKHCIAITSQKDVECVYDVPQALKEAAEGSGGYVRVMKAPTSRPLDQALELRALCQQVDLVVLHVFPYDVVPVLALASGCESVKAVYANLSDHTFWVGASVAQFVLHLRNQSIDFSTRRRGPDPARALLLPIPLSSTRSPITTAEAKRLLGFNSDIVLLLTIATPFKYQFSGAINFLDCVVPVLQQFPKAVLIAVGPEAKGAWRTARIDTNGRVFPLGAQWNNDLLYAASDVYLDSIPFSSITSLLEAGTYGVPLLGLTPHHSECHLLGPGAPGLERAMIKAQNLDHYRAALTRLVTDCEYRLALGRRVQADISSFHTGRAWRRSLHAVYTALQTCDQRGCIAATDDSFEVTSMNLALAQLYPKVHERRLIANHLEELPFTSRGIFTWRLYISGFRLCWLNLLPARSNVFVRRLGRRAKLIIHRLATVLFGPRLRVPLLDSALSARVGDAEFSANSSFAQRAE